MKLVIFGSTGGTGRELLQRALEQGHTVTAFARNRAKVDIAHVNLTVAEGDVTDAAAVGDAVGGQEAVLCALGAPAFVRTTVRFDGTGQIVRAMERAGVRRLVCQSSLGIGDSRDIRLPFYVKHIIIPVLLRHAFADHEKQERVVKESGLDWTIVRPATMTTGPRTGAYRHGISAADTGLKIKISRADVADFMLEQLVDKTYLHQTPALSY